MVFVLCACFSVATFVKQAKRAFVTEAKKIHLVLLEKSALPKVSWLGGGWVCMLTFAPTAGSSLHDTGRVSTWVGTCGLYMYTSISHHMALFRAHKHSWKKQKPCVTPIVPVSIPMRDRPHINSHTRQSPYQFPYTWHVHHDGYIHYWSLRVKRRLIT